MMDEFENEVQEESVQEKNVKKESSGLLLTVIRVVICILCIAAAAVIRWIGGSVHAQIGTLFYDHYNNSIFTGSEQPPLPFKDNAEIKETSIITESSLPVSKKEESKTEKSKIEKSSQPESSAE